MSNDEKINNARVKPAKHLEWLYLNSEAEADVYVGSDTNKTK